MMGPMVRHLAVDALERMERSGVLAQDAVGALLARHRLGAEDQALMWELVHGVVRHRDTLDAILAGFSRVVLGKVQLRVLLALRLAVYQMVYLDRIPVSAAVYQSVEVVKARFPDWVVKFANGCLRAISRSLEMKVGGLLPPEDRVRAAPIRGRRWCLFDRAVFPDPEEDPAGSLALRFSHPRWLVERWLAERGEEQAREILRAGNEPPLPWLRPSPGRLPDLCRELAKRSIRHEVEEDPPGAVRLLDPAGPVASLPGYRRGWFVIQDRTAMRAALLLGPRPGERVLDLCAAPGGKATHLAQLAGPEAQVVAVDRDEARLRRVEETRDRLGIPNLAVVCADARDPSVDLGDPFDRVLVDVPCSNTGVLAKRVEARHRTTPERVAALTAVQRDLLVAAARRLAPGGFLVYSTCALLPEENADAVDALLRRDPRLRLVSEAEHLPEAGYRDGGYQALLRLPPERET